MVKKKQLDSKYLTESAESKWVGRQIVNVIFNFDRAFQRFRRFYPNCPFNDLINERIAIMYEIIDEMKTEVPDMIILKRLLESILKIVWTIDKQMVEYIKKERKKEIEEENEFKEKIEQDKEEVEDIKNQKISNKDEINKEIENNRIN